MFCLEKKLLVFVVRRAGLRGAASSMRLFLLLLVLEEQTHVTHHHNIHRRTQPPSHNIHGTHLEAALVAVGSTTSLAYHSITAVAV